MFQRYWDMVEQHTPLIDYRLMTFEVWSGAGNKYCGLRDKRFIDTKNNTLKQGIVRIMTAASAYNKYRSASSLWFDESSYKAGQKHGLSRLVQKSDVTVAVYKKGMMLA